MAANLSPAHEPVLEYVRVYEAPRELVFKVWTEAEHVGVWWGPDGFTSTTQEMDVRPGGRWRYIMHGPDGVDYPHLVSYLEVVRPERLVYLLGDDVESGGMSFHVTVTFEQDGTKTRLTMRLRFDSFAERDKVVENYHAVEGGNQTLARLGEYVARLQQP